MGSEVETTHRDEAGVPAYKDCSLPIPQRVADLVSRMTLEEKVQQMLHESPAIPRLDIPAYNWWNECLHGVARAGLATMFPQAIGLAATWNTDLIHRMAVVISDEARAKHHEFLRKGERDIYKGLTFWSPNINIFRDPRWGRGQETYGECPYLTSRIGVAFCKGLQGDDSRYLKVVATPKHFAVHSGPEPLRHGFDARVSPKDLRETYLPAFKACVQEAKAFSVMGAYNRTNGEPCCASPTLLQKILRDEWGFEGYVVSDCGAICDIHAHHKVTSRPPESAALAVNSGCELNCGQTYGHLLNAIEEGLISEETIDVAVKRLFTARFRLGMFDPPQQVSYASIPYEINDCSEHRATALQVAHESIVLLKNTGGLLPLERESIRSLAVIGPNADRIDTLRGNYFGDPPYYVTPLQGIIDRVGGDCDVKHVSGCELWGGTEAGFDEAISLAGSCDVVIMCMGLSPALEGEEGDVANSDGGGDRIGLDLPGRQQQLIEAIHATGTPMVLVLFGGSPISINWAEEHLSAILFAWYPGQEGGHAVADVLFGDYNPAGRLPVTFVRSLDQLPPFEDYRMAGRTYRYMTDEPLYPFGFGLSYTRFKYDNLRLSAASISAGQPLTIHVDVTNVGDRSGDEVVQLYLTDMDACVDVPLRQLRRFERIRLDPGQKKNMTFTLTPGDMSLIDARGRCLLEPGEFIVSVGGEQPPRRPSADGAANVVAASFQVTGDMLELND